MPRRISSREARSRFADLIGSVRYAGDEVIVERSGRPMAAVIPVPLYEQMVAERKARFDVVDRIRSRSRALAPEDVERVVASAIAEVREADAEGGH
ncbi:MAG: type II toxin-antitoxin system Phd/YefM family antitoxin [Deltaproteobacteria bacterium]|nr:type II toxin-antitoxin system Phd/YefM family antitoxin [Deltaproteobacteria bacterium]MBW2284955.1 type II toxin-antitoxin system Phd/YefM family antitoxin [Deltaproteobacteria bacterium]